MFQILQACFRETYYLAQTTAFDDRKFDHLCCVQAVNSVLSLESGVLDNVFLLQAAEFCGTWGLDGIQSCALPLFVLLGSPMLLHKYHCSRVKTQARFFLLRLGDVGKE